MANNRDNGSKWYSGNGSQPPQWFKPFLKRFDELNNRLGRLEKRLDSFIQEQRKANEEQKKMNKILLEIVTSRDRSINNIENLLIKQDKEITLIKRRLD